MLVVGQTSQVDPTRTPDERKVVWIQVRALPSTITADSLGEITGTDWDEVKEVVADRVMAELEGYAPGLAATVRSRTVHSPMDLERSKPNLVGEDSVSGSHHVAQNFSFRPWNGMSGYATDVPGLYLVRAATWPGGVTNALSGYLCAKLLLGRGPTSVVTRTARSFAGAVRRRQDRCVPTVVAAPRHPPM